MIISVIYVLNHLTVRDLEYNSIVSVGDFREMDYHAIFFRASSASKILRYLLDFLHFMGSLVRSTG